MVARGNLTWRQAVLSALLMSSAVSANYEQTRSTHGGAVDAARSIEQADRHVQERGILEELNSLIGGLTGAASKIATADAATPSSSTEGL